MLKIIKEESFNTFKKGPVRRSLFSNGASVVSHYASGFNGAKVLLNFLAGSAFENKNEEGIAHLIEHLMFKENQSDLIAKLEMMGAEINAYTYKESVCFELNCLAKKLNSILPIFLELFMDLDFLDSQLSKEKLIIKQELKEDKDDHEAQGIEYIFKKNFDRAYGHPVGGNSSSVLKFKRTDIEKYFKKYFIPSRTSLVVVSGEKVKAEEYLIQYYQRDKTKRSNPVRLNSNGKTAKLNHTKVTKKKKLESPVLYLSFNGPSMMGQDYMSYVVLDDILFEGISSVFFKKLREEKPLVYGFGSSLNCFPKFGNYLMIFNGQENHFGEIETIITDVFKNIETFGISKAILDATKDKIKDSWDLSFDDLSERADYLLENEIYQMHEHTHDKIKKLLDEVDEKSIKKIIKNFFFKNEYSRLKIVKK